MVVTPSEIVDNYIERRMATQVGTPLPRLLPTRGDQIDVGHLRLLLVSLFSYAPEVRTWLYMLGEDLGARLARLMEAKGMPFKAVGTAPFNFGTENYTIRQEAENRFIIENHEGVYSYGMPDIEVPFDYLDAGMFAGLLGAALGKRFRVVETMCAAKGDPFCRFEAGLADELAAGTFVEEPPLGTRLETLDKIVNHYVERISRLAFASPGGVPTIRKELGDTVDLSYYRMILAGIFSYSPEVKPWLYFIGKKSGQKSAKYWKISRSGRLIAGVRLILFRNFTIRRKGQVVGRILRSGGRVFFDEYECPSCTGMPDIGEAFGYYQAGFHAGLWSERFGKDMSAIEVDCVGKGDRFCRFEIKELTRGPSPR